MATKTKRETDRERDMTDC